MTDFPKQFLEQVKEALNRIDEIRDAVTWKESKWDTPELVPIHEDRETAVDPELFKKVDSLIRFLTLTLFGVDEEGRSRGKWVDYYLKDVTRDETPIHWCRIPRVDYGSPLRDIVRAREMAQTQAKVAQGIAEGFDRLIQMELERQFACEDFSQRARNCKTCKGKGYIVIGKEEYRRQSRENSYDSRFHKRTVSDLQRAGYPIDNYWSVLCDDCQPDEIMAKTR